MPIVFQYAGLAENYSGAVWHSIEPLESLADSLKLDEAEQAILAGFRTAHRRREWLTVRRLLAEFYPDTAAPSIRYTLNGQPQLTDGSRISISHSGDYVTLCWSPDHRLGCDLESIRPQIQRLAGKFVGPREQTFLGEGPSLEALHLLWGAKESLFKLYGKGGVDFRKDLEVAPFALSSSGEINGWIRKPDFNREVLLRYRFFQDMLLVHAALPEGE